MLYHIYISLIKSIKLYLILLSCVHTYTYIHLRKAKQRKQTSLGDRGTITVAIKAVMFPRELIMGVTMHVMVLTTKTPKLNTLSRT